MAIKNRGATKRYKWNIDTDICEHIRKDTFFYNRRALTHFPSFMSVIKSLACSRNEMHCISLLIFLWAKSWQVYEWINQSECLMRRESKRWNGRRKERVIKDNSRGIQRQWKIIFEGENTLWWKVGRITMERADSKRTRVERKEESVKTIRFEDRKKKNADDRTVS